jgi:hypothetical protein
MTVSNLEFSWADVQLMTATAKSNLEFPRAEVQLMTATARSNLSLMLKYN